MQIKELLHCAKNTEIKKSKEVIALFYKATGSGAVGQCTSLLTLEVCIYISFDALFNENSGLTKILHKCHKFIFNKNPI